MRHNDLTLSLVALAARLLTTHGTTWVDGEIVQQFSQAAALVRVPVPENVALPAAKGVLRREDVEPAAWQQLRVGSRVRVRILESGDPGFLHLSMKQGPCQESSEGQLRKPAVREPFDYIPTDRATASTKRTFTQAQREQKKREKEQFVVLADCWSLLLQTAAAQFSRCEETTPHAAKPL
ncbi:car [Symbiodinium natans]|uniref:Car protein n=1 Tax=Symbiodinium natans TaxID=878477 RepID=A0A812R4V9_9DINO|nr:car [Symbiodinium natans]